MIERLRGLLIFAMCLAAVLIAIGVLLNAELLFASSVLAFLALVGVRTGWYLVDLIRDYARR